jgi:dUTP pyrophosphatase
MSLVLKIKKLHPEAKIPNYAHHGDAGMDLFSLEQVIVLAGGVSRVRSGISVEIPEGYVGLCWDKSGLSVNHGIKVLAGVIDSGYRGELVMAVINLGEVDYIFQKGDKVMQMLVQKVENPEIVEVDQLAESARGKKGFGSTGR